MFISNILRSATNGVIEAGGENFNKFLNTSSKAYEAVKSIPYGLQDRIYAGGECATSTSWSLGTAAAATGISVYCGRNIKINQKDKADALDLGISLLSSTACFGAATVIESNKWEQNTAYLAAGFGVLAGLVAAYKIVRLSFVNGASATEKFHRVAAATGSAVFFSEAYNLVQMSQQKC